MSRLMFQMAGVPYAVVRTANTNKDASTATLRSERVSTMKKFQKNCITVLNRLAKMCEDDEDFAAGLCDDLNRMLDEIHSQDGFGTEGQSDPRGDFRNGRWSMSKVEPVGKSGG
jgi:hypothetical protein